MTMIFNPAPPATPSQVPYFVPDGESYTAQDNKQVVFKEAIQMDGDLIADGDIIEA